MTVRIYTRAAGKLVLFGEYAVLEGEPALVTSVDRFVSCEIVEAPKFELDTIDFGRYDAESLHNASPLLQAIMAKETLTPHRIRLNSSAFFEGDAQKGQKLGIGSSAAVSVALIKALGDLRGHPLSPQACFVAAHGVHHSLQGLGSGADIAAAAFGGAFHYQLHESTSAATMTNNAVQIRLDSMHASVTQMPELENMPLLGVHLGSAASTPKFVRGVQKLKESNEAQYKVHMRALGVIASKAYEAWSTQNIQELMECADANNETLRALGRAAGVQIIPETLNHLNQALRPVDSIAKTTGAGGGDMAWVVCRDAQHTAAVCRALKGQWNTYLFEVPKAIPMTKD